MRKLLLLFMATGILLGGYSKEYTLQSPDKKISTAFFIENGEISYSVTIDNKTVLESSPLGVITTNGNLSKDLKLNKASKIRSISEDYILKFGKKREVKYRANEITYSLENDKSQKINIEFRAANDGIAFRYVLIGKGNAEIISEKSGFKLPENTLAFITPLSKAKTGWKRTNPSYEEFYHLDQKVGTPSDFGQGWTYPALFKLENGSWVMLSETNVDGNYVGTHLADNSDKGLYRVEFPHLDHNLMTDPTSASVTLPYTTPWRTINVGSLSNIVESTMAQDLAKPIYDAKYDYKPGKAAWSWIILKDDNVVYDVQKKYIDMAAELNWEYVLIDGLWDVQIGREKIAELAAYAASKNIGLLLWYNSNGPWNDAPQTPQNCMDTKEVRIKEMAWMQSIGIKGIKVDFFGGDKQCVMKLYDDILRDANDYGITVNFHGTTLPRGWERMYPNFVTNESVKGQEFITFEQPVADHQPQHCATLVFTRNVVAPMDFTPLALNTRLGVKPNSGPIRRTTAGFELALPIMFFSSVQHLALVPENIKEFPAFVIDYLKKVPTVWDETKLLAGYPGKNAVFARRSGDKWYLAGINAEANSIKLSFDLPFITTATDAKLIRDTPTWNQVAESNIKITPKEPFEVELQAHGGFVMMIK